MSRLIPAILIVTLFVFIVALVKKTPEPAPTSNEIPAIVETPAPTTTTPDLSSPRSERGSTTSTTSSTPREAAPPPPAAPARVAFTIEADDTSFTPAEIHVTRGATVSLTFRVRTTGVYYGGLDIRSNAFNTGTISPGGIKTISFIATTSLDFSSYWPLTNTLKTTGHVVVE